MASSPAAASDVAGFLLINKPVGPTSYDIIRRVKPLFRGAKIGHAGTLDPFASGLVIVLLGRATKKQAAFMSMEKTYVFTLQLGCRTDTGDPTGATVETQPVPPRTDDQVREVLARFTGPQRQVPPMYSALKHKGQPLYKYARKGEEIERAAREVTIHELTLLSRDGDRMSLRARCSSGTYVRTLAEDLGAALGTCATTTALTRAAIGPYSVADAFPMDALAHATADEVLLQVRAAS